MISIRSLYPAALLLSTLLLTTGCEEDRGSCFLGDEEAPWVCTEISDQVSASEAKEGCSSIGGQWRESSCALENAVGQCVDAAGSVTIYYEPYLSEISLTSEDLAETCTEQQGTYSEL